MARQLLQEDAVTPVRETDLPIDVEPDKDVVYYVRPITVEHARAVAKKHTRLVPNKRTHQRDEVVDHTAARDELLDYCLVKWDGVNERGKLAMCDLAHKLLLPVSVQAALLEWAQAGQQTPEEAADSFRTPA